MKPFMADRSDNSGASLYIQLYRHIKDEILAGNLKVGDKLPSLRSIASDSAISVTTADLAYNQLLTEGYIVSKPQSGYYVAELPTSYIKNGAKDKASSYGGKSKSAGQNHDIKKGQASISNPEFDDFTFDRKKYLYDLSTFDFTKWKKCGNRVLNEYADMLLFESDVQGEPALRFEICKYLYSSRGVTASPEQVVIGAGTQQLTSHLARILSMMGIDLIATEDPGYVPIQNIFRDRGFGIRKIPVTESGIMIEKLSVNIPTAVYVSPANQFPTGSVMPIGSRYQLLEWARNNGSFILEDDYDSELRYSGQPVPALQGLDESDSVIYLGSFSSTLFPAVKISYMILPERMVDIFRKIKNDYTQTCSKAEQLTLALFMEDGYYYTNIRKLRSLYAQKMQAVVDAFDKYGVDKSGKRFIEVSNTQSGTNVTLAISGSKSCDDLCSIGQELGLRLAPLSSTSNKKRHLIFYFNQVPLPQLDTVIRDYCQTISP